MGVVLTADGVAEATAPFLVSVLRDRNGTYDVAFFALVGAAVVGAAAIAVLPRHRLPGRAVPAPIRVQN